MSRYKNYDDYYPYFITANIMFGLPLFSNRNAGNIIIENLKFMQKQREVNLIAYVIMENHLHAILQSKDLADKVGRFKSYSARRIIDLFKQKGTRVGCADWKRLSRKRKLTVIISSGRWIITLNK